MPSLFDDPRLQMQLASMGAYQPAPPMLPPGMPETPPMPGLLTPPGPSGIPTSPPPDAGAFKRLMWTLQHRGTGTAPEGYEQILGAKTVEDARPSTLDVVFGGARKIDFRKNLDQAVADRMRPVQVQEMLRQKQLAKNIAAQFQLPEGASPEDVKNNFAKMYYTMVQQGVDPELIKTITPVAGQAIQPTTTEMPYVMGNDPGENIALDKRTGKWIPGPAKSMNPDQIEAANMDRAVKKAQIAALLAGKHNTDVDTQTKFMDSQAKQFASQNRDIVTSARAIELARVAFDELKAGNPVAYKSAIIAFASVADPKAQLRQGIIEMIMKLDPSVQGSAQIAAYRLSQGNLPPYILNGIIKHVENTRKAMADLYDKRRTGLDKMHPGVSAWIAPSEDIFGGPLGGEVPAGGKLMNYDTSAPASAPGARPVHLSAPPIPSRRP